MDKDSLESLGSYSICGGEGPPSPSGYPGEYSSAVESPVDSDEEDGRSNDGERGGEGPLSPRGYPGEYSSAVESPVDSDEEDGRSDEGERQPEGGSFVFQNNYIEIFLRVQRLQGPHYWFSIGLRVTLDGRRWFRLPTFETNISWEWPGQTAVEEVRQLRNGRRRRRFQIVEVLNEDGDEEDPSNPPTQHLRRSARLAGGANPST